MRPHARLAPSLAPPPRQPCLPAPPRSYDARTLYVPPEWLKANKVSPGQLQWWEFKARNMDAVLLFKMGAPALRCAYLPVLRGECLVGGGKQGACCHGLCIGCL